MHVQTQQLPIRSLHYRMMRAPNLRNFATMTSLTPSLTPSLLFSGPLLFHATYVFSCLLSWHGPRMVNVSMYTYIHSPSQFSNLRKPSTIMQFLDPPTYPWLPQVVCMILCACMTNSTSGRGGGRGFLATQFKNQHDHGPNQQNIMSFWTTVVSILEPCCLECALLRILFSTSVPTHKCLT